MLPFSRVYLRRVVNGSALIFFAAAHGGVLASPALAQRAPQATTQDEQMRKNELALKERELELKVREFDSSRRLEYLKVLLTAGSVVVAFLAVFLPIKNSIRTLAEQRTIANDANENQAKIAREDSKVQFQMKVAELAFSTSQNAMQAREKARALASLFDSQLPANFAERFDPKKFRLSYGESNEMRRDLIRLMAERPQERTQILSDWYVLFGWDGWWVEPLLSGLGEARIAELKALQDKVKANEAAVNAQREAKTDP